MAQLTVKTVLNLDQQLTIVAENFPLLLPQGRRNRGAGGIYPLPHISADQLTLFQPGQGGQIMPTTSLLGPLISRPSSSSVPSSRNVVIRFDTSLLDLLLDYRIRVHPNFFFTTCLRISVSETDNRLTYFRCSSSNNICIGNR